MKKVNLIKMMVLASALIFLAQACKDTKADSMRRMHDNHDMHSGDHSMMGSNHMAGQMQSKVVQVGDLHFAFDLMPIGDHMNMMKSMHMSGMMAPGDASHGLMITVIDKKSGNMVPDASLDVVFTGTKGQSLSMHCENMTGSGMHHYSAHVKLPNSGKWKIKATATIGDKKTVAETEFDIE